MPHALPSDSPLSLIQGLFRETPSVTVSLIVMALIVVGGLWIGGRVISTKEYVLEQ